MLHDLDHARVRLHSAHAATETALKHFEAGEQKLQETIDNLRRKIDHTTQDRDEHIAKRTDTEKAVEWFLEHSNRLTNRNDYILTLLDVTGLVTGPAFYVQKVHLGGRVYRCNDVPAKTRTGAIVDAWHNHNKFEEIKGLDPGREEKPKATLAWADLPTGHQLVMEWDPFELQMSKYYEHYIKYFMERFAAKAAKPYDTPPDDVKWYTGKMMEGTAAIECHWNDNGAVYRGKYKYEGRDRVTDYYPTPGEVMASAYRSKQTIDTALAAAQNTATSAPSATQGGPDNKLA